MDSKDAQILSLLGKICIYSIILFSIAFILIQAFYESTLDLPESFIGIYSVIFALGLIFLIRAAAFEFRNNYKKSK
jgi:hypothetical protein